MPPESLAAAHSASQAPRRAWLAFLLLAAFAVFLLFFRLGSRDLDGSHEARAALNAKWYLDHGWFGLSRLPDGTLEAQKPPGYYWAVSLATSVFGLDKPDPWTTRLPAALSGVLVLSMVVFVSTRKGCFSQGVIGAFILLGMAAFVWLSRTARTDAVLAGAIATGLLALEGGRNSLGWQRLGWHALATSGFALGWMVKGPMAVVLPAAIVIARLAMDPANRSVWQWACQGFGVLTLASALVVPWYYWADWSTGGHFWAEFFGLHHVGRGLGGSRLREHPFWFYLAQLPASSFPAVLLLPLSMWAWLKRTRANETNMSREMARLGMAWVVGGMVLLSLARFKRADYLMPVFPGLAVWLAFSLWEVGKDWLKGIYEFRNGLSVKLAVVVMALWCGCWFGVVESQTVATGRAQWASEIKQSILPKDELVFFQLEDHLLAHHLGRTYSTQVVWGTLLESATKPDGVVVITGEPRLQEGWFVDPKMMVKVIASLAAEEGKTLVCVRLRNSEAGQRVEVVQDAPVRNTSVAGGAALYAGPGKVSKD